MIKQKFKQLVISPQNTLYENTLYKNTLYENTLYDN